MTVLLGDRVKNLVSEYVKINPAGIDLAPKAIFRVPEDKIDYAYFHGKQRGYFIDGEFVPLVEALQRVEPKNNFWELDKGIYYVVFPKVKIPEDMVALAFPRSTLNRLGLIKIQTAVFDPGYEGEFNQTWYIPFKIKIHINEAWVQLVFFKLENKAKDLYRGHWQNEKY